MDSNGLCHTSTTGTGTVGNHVISVGLVVGHKCEYAVQISTHKQTYSRTDRTAFKKKKKKKFSWITAAQLYLFSVNRCCCLDKRCTGIIVLHTLFDNLFSHMTSLIG